MALNLITLSLLIPSVHQGAGAGDLLSPLCTLSFFLTCPFSSWRALSTHLPSATLGQALREMCGRL